MDNCKHKIQRIVKKKSKNQAKGETTELLVKTSK